MTPIPSQKSLIPSEYHRQLDAAGLILVAVSKDQLDEKLLLVAESGYQHFGENTLFGLERAHTLFQHRSNIHLHFVGRLQSNKIRKICDLKPLMVHSLAQRGHLEMWLKLQNEGLALPQLLLQINCANNPNQEGLKPDLESLAALIQEFKALPLVGLMAIGPNPDRFSNTGQWQAATKTAFAALASLKRYLNQSGFMQIRHLSMGMSQDYALALEAGASLLRIGTLIFGSQR